MLRITVFVLLFISTFCSYAIEPNKSTKYTGVIEGRVFDTQKSPVEFANVVLFSKKDSSLYNGATTDKEGNFKISNVPDGEFYLNISIVGFKTKTINNLLVSKDNKVVKVNNVNLEPTAVQLGSVGVIGEKNNVEYKLDKQVVNVSKDISSAGGTAIDVLQKQPSVQVDQDGNITLRGSSNFTVQINGRPGPLQGNDALRQIPANLIENIEIITNPSAKYDAEGSAGIINIVMKKTSENSYSAIINGGAGSRDKYNGDFTVNYRAQKYALSGGLDYRNTTNFMTQNFLSTTNMLSDTRFYTTGLDGKFKRENYNIKASFDYYLTDKNVLTLNASGGKVDFFRDFNFNNHEYYDISDNLKYSLTVDKEDLKVDYYNTSLFYNHNIQPDVQDINLEANINYVDLPSIQSSNEYTTDETFKNVIANPFLHDLNNNSKKVESRIKLNYSYKINPKSTFEMGLQSNLFYKNIDFIDKSFDWNMNAWNTNPLTSNRFDFRNNVYAGFINYVGNLFDFDYQFGLRTEYTDRLLKQKSLAQNFEYGKMDYFPSFYISRALSEGEQIQFSYSRRINRPQEYALNPFPAISLSYVTSIGNPKLLPEYTNSFELNYNKSFGAVFFRAQTYYRQTNNGINQSQSADENGIILLTFENLAKTKNLGAEFSSNVPVTSWLKLDPSINFFQYNLEGTIANKQQKADIFTWNARINTTISFAQDLRLQIFANHNAKSLTPQGDIKPIYFVNLTLRKEFFERALIATFQVQNAFNTIRYKFSSNGENLKMSGNVRPEAPVYNLTFSFNFNNFKRSQRAGENVDININPGL